VATILVFIEDAGIRNLMMLVLQQDGHTVWEIRSAGEAKGICSGVLVDIIVADMVLHGYGMTTELALAVMRSQPQIRILFLIGHAIEPIPDFRGLEQLPARSYLFLWKPFDVLAILDSVRLLSGEPQASKGRRKNNFTDWERWCSSIWAGPHAAGGEGLGVVQESVRRRLDSCAGPGEQ
jgi:DNA-binding NtrC family response regulator